MGRLSYVYNGHAEEDRNKDEVIHDILSEYKVAFDKNTLKAMNEALRVGWIRGEEYGMQEIIADYESGRRRVKDKNEENDDD